MIKETIQKVLINNPVLNGIEKWSFILLFAGALITFIMTSLQFFLGFISGGLISICNFHCLGLIVSRVVSIEGCRVRKYMLTRYFLRFIILAILLFILIKIDLVNIIGLFLGISIPVLIIPVQGIRFARNGLI